MSLTSYFDVKHRF